LQAEVAHKFLAELLNHKDVRGLLSDEHFSVDGTQVAAWASMKSFRAKDGSDEPPPRGRNGERERLSTFWQNVPIDNEGGFIPGVYPEDLPDADPEIEDNRPEQYLPRHRYLFVPRDQIFQLWNEPISAAKRPPVASDEDQIQAIEEILQEDGKIKRTDMNRLRFGRRASGARESAQKTVVEALSRALSELSDPQRAPQKEINVSGVANIANNDGK
jgi:hypothetical protein